jgi:hypothetical protein
MSKDRGPLPYTPQDYAHQSRQFHQRGISFEDWIGAVCSEDDPPETVSALLTIWDAVENSGRRLARLGEVPR